MVMKVDFAMVYNLFPSAEILGVAEYYCFCIPKGWKKLDPVQGESAVSQVRRALDLGATRVTLRLARFKEIKGEVNADFALDELTKLPRNVLEARSSLRANRLQLQSVEVEVKGDLIGTLLLIFRQEQLSLLRIEPTMYYQDSFRCHKFVEVRNDSTALVSIFDNYGVEITLPEHRYVVQLKSIAVDRLIEITVSVVHALQNPMEKEEKPDPVLTQPRQKVIL